jgi:hypothetical protein
MYMSKRVKLRHVAIAETGGSAADGEPHQSRIIATDEKGRLWERVAGMPDGKWGEVLAPEEPATGIPARRTRKRRAAKR